jgi:hypothetical protein
MPPEYGRSTFNMGAASYGGESAVGVSASRLFGSGVMLSGGTSTGLGAGRTLTRVGVGMTW